jgi:large subunit ribosomal protein L23
VLKIDPRQLPDIVRRPILTEKATRLMEQNKYTFDVTPQASKPQIKAAIEDLFEVKVGFKPQYKRAIVTVAPGDEDKIRQVLFPDV